MLKELINVSACKIQCHVVVNCATVVITQTRIDSFWPAILSQQAELKFSKENE